MSRSSSYSSLSNYFTLGVPILGLLVTLYIGALSLIQPSIANLLSSFCSCYAIILYLNLSIVVTVLGQRHLPYSVDPDSCQPIRIFHPRDGKSPLARLLLAPWRPFYILLVSDRLLLLLSLVFLYGSNLQALVQKHLYEPVILY